MTCIVGLVDGGIVTIGGDSAGIAGHITQQRADPKVFASGPYVIGYTSSFRMGQILRYGFEPPLPPKDASDLHGFMCTVFVDAVREALKAAGWATKDSEQEAGGCFLVGVAGQLFEIQSDYQVGQLADGYTAVGCGEQFALGALHATETSDAHRLTRVTAALKAATHFSTGVRPPFTIVSTPTDGESDGAMMAAPEPPPYDPSSITTTNTSGGAVTVTIDGNKLYEVVQQSHEMRRQRGW
ncbi:MAG: hypothetical protein JWL97_3494 [Gemmatimonadales bacterium]|nr:hypothetical protein [Gemmatimonadales bacterium]